MALALIQYFPSSNEGIQRFTFNNASEHTLIIQAIQSKLNFGLQPYVIDPFTPDDPEGWLDRHQQMHSDFNSVLGYPGNDLQTVDLRNPEERLSWSWLHFQEHLNANIQLGILS